ncbi:MAG: hypothetical protein ABWZ25_05920 [Chitinophagaceae bacterium]
MKKFILTLAIVVSGLCSFAAEKDVNILVLKSFQKEFSGVKDVQWTSTGEIYKASFVFNNQYVFAFFAPHGELVGITRNVSSLELPVTLQASLKKEHSGYWISSLFEVSNSEGTRYFITIENADTKVVLSSGGSSWKLYKKASKI